LSIRYLEEIERLHGNIDQEVTSRLTARNAIERQNNHRRIQEAIQVIQRERRARIQAQNALADERALRLREEFRNADERRVRNNRSMELAFQIRNLNITIEDLRRQIRDRNNNVAAVECIPIRDFLRGVSDEKDEPQGMTSHILCVDVHYYLPENPFSQLSQGWHLYVVGSLFCTEPGNYRLPFGNGTYTNSNGRISMLTRGSGRPYQHPLVVVDTATNAVSTGFFTQFIYAGPADAYKQRPISSPNLSLNDKILRDYSRQDIFCEMMRSVLPKGVLGSKMLTSTMNYRDVIRWAKYSTKRISVRSTNMERDPKSIWLRYSQIPRYLKIESKGKFHFVKKVFKRTYLTVIDTDIAEDNSFNWFGDFLRKINGRYVQEGKRGVMGMRVVTGTMPNGARIAGDKDPIETELAEKFNAEQIVDMEHAYNIGDVDFAPMRFKRAKDFEKSKKYGVHEDSKSFLFIKPMDESILMREDRAYSIQDLYRADTVHRVNSAIEEAIKMQEDDHFPAMNGELITSPIWDVTLTGMDFHICGKQQYSFEFNSKSQHNALYGMAGRHLLPKVHFDQQVMDRFLAFCNRKWDQVWDELEKEIADSFLNNPFDYLSWLVSKNETGWTEPKCKDYAQIIQKQLKAYAMGGSFRFLNEYKTMTKKGETYYTDELPVHPLLPKVSARPRNIFVPPLNNRGMPVYIQSFLWRPIKKIFPGFIHGYTKDDYKKLFDEAVKNGDLVISLDGSAYDSTQWAEMMDGVENNLFRRIRNSDRIYKAFVKCYDSSIQVEYNMSPVNLRRFWLDLWEQLCKNETTAFVYCPAFLTNARPWRDEFYQQAWRADVKEDRENLHKLYLPIPLKGTTFSGHSTKTTLGNTFRSIFMAEFWAEESGTTGHFVIASGDDTAIFGKNLANLMATIRMNSHTSKNPNDPIRGLGQIITEISIGSWKTVDFCSKWFIAPTNEPGDVVICRDPVKTLATRGEYVGNNDYIKARPHLHAQAIYEGFKAEKISRLVESLIFLRNHKLLHDKPVDEKELSFLSDRYRYAFTSKEGQGYEAEEEINAKIGVDQGTLFNAVVNHYIETTPVSGSSDKDVEPIHKVTFMENSTLAKVSSRTETSQLRAQAKGKTRNLGKKTLKAKRGKTTKKRKTQRPKVDTSKDSGVATLKIDSTANVTQLGDGRLSNHADRTSLHSTIHWMHLPTRHAQSNNIKANEANQA
jgi:hypothetical protein